MKNRIRRLLGWLSLMLLLVFCTGAATTSLLKIVKSRVVAGGDYCSSQTWNTLTAFRWDGNHTDDARNACLTSGTETGTLTSGTIETPSPTSPGSAGNALLENAANEHLAFSNSGSYFNSTFGELMFKFLYVTDSGQRTLFDITAVAGQDRIFMIIGANGIMTATWEDNNLGTVAVTGCGLDFDSAGLLNHWAQVHLKWDTTICTAPTTCQEIAVRCRVDTNDDGDFGDGGSEDWTAWVASTVSLSPWAAEPSTNQIVFLNNATVTGSLYIDDIEFTPTQPSFP